MSEKIKKHWNQLGKNYSVAWLSKAKQKMSEKEEEYIVTHVPRGVKRKILDIGIGNGRIVDMYLKNTQAQMIYGLDISSEMVNICKKKFKKNKRVKALKAVDLLNSKFPYKIKFDYITAIRVLKYNKEWKRMIDLIVDKLSINGMFTFTMINNYSITHFAKYGVDYYRTTVGELKLVCEKQGLEIVEMDSFTKLPDFFYDFSDNLVYVKFLLFVEYGLRVLLGRIIFGRVLFITVRKVHK